MRLFLPFLGLLAMASAQAVTELIVPSSTPPAGCQNSRAGTFTITIVNVTTSNNSSVAPPSRRAYDRPFGRPLLGKRQQDGVLTLSLVGGILKDQANRTGYVASNYQFQFDAPPQAGAIYTAGFGLCPNGSISLGGNAVWWQCLSGSFYNLYDRDWAEHCVPVYFVAIGGAGSVYSTAPPGPETTGPSENTIANGGGTQSNQATTATFGIDSTSSTGSSASATRTSATESGTAAATSSSSAFGVLATALPQSFFHWAVGLAGAAVAFA